MIDAQVLDFIRRLEEEPGLDLRAVFSESPVRGFRGIAIDAWRRRGFLAPVIVLAFLISSIGTALIGPRLALARRRTRKMLESRIHFCRDIHDPEVLSAIRAINPTVGLVYGGPIVRHELFEIPDMGTLGIHHGKVPEYRGKKTTFWAIYNGETEVSVIIQRIGKKLDAGEIVARADIAVNNRPLPVIKKKLEQAGIDIYVRAVQDVVAGRAEYVVQLPGPRSLYKDPTAMDIVRFWWKYACRLFE